MNSVARLSAELAIAPATVRAYVEQLREVLGLNEAEAVIALRRTGAIKNIADFLSLLN